MDIKNNEEYFCDKCSKVKLSYDDPNCLRCNLCDDMFCFICGENILLKCQDSDILCNNLICHTCFDRTKCADCEEAKCFEHETMFGYQNDKKENICYICWMCENM